MAVKGSQSALAGPVSGTFDALEHWPAKYAGTVYEYREINNDYGRIWTRHCVSRDISLRRPGKVDGRWPGSRTLAMVEATRETCGVAPAEHLITTSAVCPPTRAGTPMQCVLTGALRTACTGGYST